MGETFMPSFKHPDELRQHQLEGLQWTVNHRDIYADTVRDFLLNPNLGAVLPGHTATPLGLFG